MLRIKELNLTCMINDSERITEKQGHYGSTWPRLAVEFELYALWDRPYKTLAFSLDC